MKNDYREPLNGGMAVAENNALDLLRMDKAMLMAGVVAAMSPMSSIPASMKVPPRITQAISVVYDALDAMATKVAKPDSAFVTNIEPARIDRKSAKISFSGLDRK